MITKERFVKTIEGLRKETDYLDKLMDLNQEHERDDMTGYSQSFDVALELLEDAMDLDKDNRDILIWWMFDLDFGREFEIGHIFVEEGENIYKPDLSTAEDLYDFFVRFNSNKYADKIRETFESGKRKVKEVDLDEVKEYIQKGVDEVTPKIEKAIKYGVSEIRKFLEDNSEDETPSVKVDIEDLNENVDDEIEELVCDYLVNKSYDEIDTKELDALIRDFLKNNR